MHEPQEIELHASTRSLAFFPDGTQAVHISAEQEVATLLQVRDGRRMGPWMKPARVAAVSKDAKWIVCGCIDGKVRISGTDGPEGQTIETNDHHPREVSALDMLTSSSSKIASGALDGSVCVWDLATGQRLGGPFYSESLRLNRVTSLQFSPGGDHLAVSCAVSRTVLVLNVDDNKLTLRIEVSFSDASCITGISWTSQSQIMVGLDESLVVVDPSDGSQIRKPIPGFRALSSNMRFIVSSSQQAGIRFWDAANFTRVGPTVLPPSHLIALSPANTILVSVSHNSLRKLSVWNLPDILPSRYFSSDDLPAPTSTVSGSSSPSTREGNEAILSMIQRSSDPNAHRNPQLYASSSQKRTAEYMIHTVLNRRPPVLIDTWTGCLCYESLIPTLEADPAYANHLSSIGNPNLDSFSGYVEHFFKYVMFSHRWDQTYTEPVFNDIRGKSVYDLGRSKTNDKLRNFCRAVRETGHRWAWSDTCCIDKTNPSVLNCAIVSMYRWYKESVLTLALLANAPSPSKPGNLRDDVWMTRAWTLQELLAPKAIRFYDSEWKPYLDDPYPDHRCSPTIKEELASAMSIGSATLSNFSPCNLTALQKLCLASTRVATESQDVAYSLFGLFASDLQPIDSDREGGRALGRLLQEIIDRSSSDVTILAWTGEPSSFNSCLPSSLAVYKRPLTAIKARDASRLRMRVVELRSSVPYDRALQIYSKITMLPNASFASRRLRLPCIVFAVQGLTRVIDDIYKFSVSVLGNITIQTCCSLPVRTPTELFLVHPWINDLRKPTGEIFQVSDDRNADPFPFCRVCITADSLQSDSDEHSCALLLIARLELEFNALLLQRHSSNGYQRVACDRDIVVRIPGVPSLDTKDIRAEVLDVCDPQIGIP